MFRDRMISVPRVEGTLSRSEAVEWSIPDRVSVALVHLEDYGFTLMAKVRVDKRHFWSRSWKTFADHAPTVEEAMDKGLEFLEPHGYTIEYDTDRLKEILEGEKPLKGL